MNEQERLRVEKAVLNKVVGKGDISDVGHRFKNTLAEALNEAYAEANVTPPPAPVYKREWKSKVSSQTMVWERSSRVEFFEGLQVEVQRFGFDKIHETPFATYAEVKFKGEPNYIGLAFTAKVKEGRRILHAQKDVVTDVTDGNISVLRVFVDWQNGIPHCRAKHRDNINIIFLDPDGAHVVMLEVSVTSRAGHFWVAIQELWAGQIARTTATKAQGLDLTALPLNGFAGLGIPVYPENNFPDSSFLDNFRDQAPGIIRYAAEQGIIAPLSKCNKPPEWNPETAPEAPKGWQVATVLWFNLVIGWGFARLADGRNVFVHFQSIIDERGQTLASKGQFPFLEPMQQVTLRFREGDKGLQATAVRLL